MKPVYLLTLYLLATAVAAGEPPRVESQLPEAKVVVAFPASEFAVGEQKPFRVLVEPAAGKPAPHTVRGRFGMPYMHHWVTDEQAQPFSNNGMEFMSNISMMGVYRFRIWLDYAGGHQTKTAVDFMVRPGRDLSPEVVQE